MSFTPSASTPQTSFGASSQNQPPPHTTLPLASLDTLPILHSLISRIATSSLTLSAPSSFSSTQPNSTQPNNTSTPSFSTSANPSFNGTSEISIKDIPTLTDTIKHNLHDVKRKAKELPGTDWTTEEQEDEIRELEEKIERQRAVLKDLRDLGIRLKGDREMGGMEG